MFRLWALVFAVSSWVSRLSSTGRETTTLGRDAIRIRWPIVLCLAVGTLNGPLAEAQDPARASSPTARQKPELVVNRDCVEVIKPRSDFQLHVPLDKKGDPINALAYSTGKLDVKFRAHDCGRVNVGPAATPWGADESQRKKPCCDSGH
jgi:hypothetical protein